MGRGCRRGWNGWWSCREELGEGGGGGGEEVAGGRGHRGVLRPLLLLLCWADDATRHECIQKARLARARGADDQPHLEAELCNFLHDGR